MIMLLAGKRYGIFVRETKTDDLLPRGEERRYWFVAGQGDVFRTDFVGIDLVLPRGQPSDLAGRIPLNLNFMAAPLPNIGKSRAVLPCQQQLPAQGA